MYLITVLGSIKNSTYLNNIVNVIQSQKSNDWQIIRIFYDIIEVEVNLIKCSKYKNGEMFGSWDFPTLKWKFEFSLQWVCTVHYWILS